MTRRIQLGLPVEALRSVQLWVTIAVLALAPLFFGSVDLFWVALWVILLSLSALCGIGAPVGAMQSRLLLGFLGLCGVYALVAIIQTTPNLIGQLNDPNWQKANDLLDLQAPPRISSRAEIPLLAAGHFLLFATAFTNGFFIGTSRHN